MSYDFVRAEPFLADAGLANHILIRQPRGKDFPRHFESDIFDTNNLIFQHLTIILDTPLVSDCQLDSAVMGHYKLHFRHCYFMPVSLNMADLSFPWRGTFRFYQNDFIFHRRDLGVWLFVLGDGSEVTFHGNNFGGNDIQIVSTRETEADDSFIPELTWKGYRAYLLKDDVYYKAMIRKRHDLPDSVRLATPDSSRGTPHVGLRQLSLIGNGGIGKLLMRCNARHYAFRGSNHIESLSFTESWSDFEERTIYVGRRERIDPEFHMPTAHRRLFLSIKKIADERGDVALASALGRYIDRIEYFLTKEHEVSFRNSKGGWLEYWQDRWRYSWRRWSSDFYGSWVRPLTLGIVGYIGLNALAGFWMEGFTVADWVAFSLRRVDRIPFYTAWLKDLDPVMYESLATASKNWLRAIGLVQNVWVGMCGFAFSKVMRA